MKPSMNSRRVMLASAGIAAGLTGAGWAWFKHRPQPGPESSSEIWQFEARTPAGQTLRLMDFRGKPLILNFWATWCPPCVEELPLLNRFHLQNQAKWQVLALAADQPSAVTTFLQRNTLNLPVAIAGLEGTNLSRQLGNERGGLPFTVAFDRHGNVAQRKIGQISASDLDQWLQNIH